MLANLPREKEWVSWSLVGLWSLVIFVTVPLAETIQAFVSEHWGRQSFGYMTAAAVVAAGAVTVRHLARRRRGAASYAWLALVGAIFIGYTIYLRHAPEEALHFVQYGFLGVLSYRALSHRVGDWTIYVTAAMIGAIVGMLDEFLQWLTPGRFWGLGDIWLDFLAAALVQVGIAKGLRPAIISGPVRAASVRSLCRYGLLLLIVLAPTLLNTPRRIAWYSERIPALAFLKTNESAMLEYGRRFVDPEAGPFRSRFSLEELRRTDARRGAEVARILDRFRDHSTYRDFLKIYTPVSDPFTHEARVHLFRRDKHLEWARDPTGAPQYLLLEKGEEHRQRIHLTVALRENQILEKYFPVTLRHSSYVLAARQIAFLRENQLPDRELPAREVESRVSLRLITTISEQQILGMLALAALALVLIDRRYGSRSPAASAGTTSTRSWLARLPVSGAGTPRSGCAATRRSRSRTSREPTKRDSGTS